MSSNEGAVLTATIQGRDAATTSGLEEIRIDRKVCHVQMITKGASSSLNTQTGNTVNAKCEGRSCCRSQKTAMSFVTVAA